MGQEHRELGGASIQSYIRQSVSTDSTDCDPRRSHANIFQIFHIKMIKMDEQGPSYHLDVDAEAHDQAFL